MRVRIHSRVCHAGWLGNITLRLDVECPLFAPCLISCKCHSRRQESLEYRYQRRRSRFPGCPFEQTRREDARWFFEVAPELPSTPKCASYKVSSAFSIIRQTSRTSGGDLGLHLCERTELLDNLFALDVVSVRPLRRETPATPVSVSRRPGKSRDCGRDLPPYSCSTTDERKAWLRATVSEGRNVRHI